jgi:hypothetical protein
LRCSITGAADGECGDEASLSVGEEEVEAEAACISLSAGIFELETLAMALISGSEREKDMVQPHTTTIMLHWYEENTEETGIAIIT